MSKSKRIRRHVETALSLHMKPGESTEALVMTGEDAFGIMQASAPGRCHLVVTNRRLLLVDFGKGFPAKMNDTVGQFTIVKERPLAENETISFARSWREASEVRSGRFDEIVQVGELKFAPYMGWAFDSD